MDPALQKAIDCLQIRDVFLQSSSAEVAEGFEPQYDPEADGLPVQLKHVVTQTTVLELNGEEAQHLFRVYIDLGARWVETAPEDDAGEPEVKARIEGIMVAEYVMTENPGEEALRAFAMHNASYHVWPYWREFLASQCVRMNLPRLTVPTMQFAANRVPAAEP